MTAMNEASAPSPQGAPMQRSPADASALDKTMWFGVIALVGMALNWIDGYYFLSAIFPATFGLSRTPNPTPAQVGAALAPLFQNLGYVVPVAALIELASLVVLTWAFRDFAKFDRSKFFVPTIFMIIMMVGVVFVAVAFYPFINSIPALIAQAPSSGTGTLPPPFAGALRSLIVYVVLLGVAGILALIGAVGGLILGLWRVGSRYDETLIKIGAIFTIIPLLNIAAPILVLVGAHLARERLAQ